MDDLILLLPLVASSAVPFINSFNLPLERVVFNFTFEVALLATEIKIRSDFNLGRSSLVNYFNSTNNQGINYFEYYQY